MPQERKKTICIRTHPKKRNTHLGFESLMAFYENAWISFLSCDLIFTRSLSKGELIVTNLFAFSLFLFSYLRCIRPNFLFSLKRVFPRYELKGRPTTYQAIMRIYKLHFSNQAKTVSEFEIPCPCAFYPLYSYVACGKSCHGKISTFCQGSRWSRARLSRLKLK